MGTPREPRYTGVLPQLLNPIDEGIAEHLLSNPAWWAQEKYDGKRVLIRRRDQEITGINRRRFSGSNDSVVSSSTTIENPYDSRVIWAVPDISDRSRE